MKKLMFAKFKSTCFETGKTINKGEHILYDPAIKKAYCNNSQEFKSYSAQDHGDYIQDPGETYFDNWAQRNGI
jgi:hypothetical protein